MWGYHPAQVAHRGKKGSIVNVGDVVLKPYRFDEYATVRAEVLCEDDVDPSKVEINVYLSAAKTNSGSGGTNGSLPWPAKEQIKLGKDFKFQRTGLNPMKHTISVQAPGHLPLRKEFELEPGGTTDIGVLRVAASPSFDIQFATSFSTDFSKAKVHRKTVFVSESFRTNPDGKKNDWVDSGQLRIRQFEDRDGKDGTYVFHCGLAGLVITDLGKGEIKDFPRLAAPENRFSNNGELRVQFGHVYLISHNYKTWDHWTLLQVKETK